MKQDQTFILLYDGVCNLCHGLVQFVLKHEKNKVLRFSHLQSEFSKTTLSKFNISLQQLNTVYLYDKESHILYKRSSAVVRVFVAMGWPWPVLAALLWVVPKPIRDFGYGIVARYRYRWFGKKNVCYVPPVKDRFILNSPIKMG